MDLQLLQQWSVNVFDAIFECDGAIELGSFKKLYKEKHGKEYKCPHSESNPCKLKECLAKNNLIQITQIGSVTKVSIRLTEEEAKPPTPARNPLRPPSARPSRPSSAPKSTIFQDGEFPSLGASSVGTASKPSNKQQNPSPPTEDEPATANAIQLLASEIKTLLLEGGDLRCSAFRTKYKARFKKDFICPDTESCGHHKAKMCLNTHFPGLLAEGKLSILGKDVGKLDAFQNQECKETAKTVAPTTNRSHEVPNPALAQSLFANNDSFFTQQVQLPMENPEFQRVVQVLNDNQGQIQLVQFKAMYKKKFENRYKCPCKPKCQNLGVCIPLHFGKLIALTNGPDGSLSVRLRAPAVPQPNEVAPHFMAQPPVGAVGYDNRIGNALVPAAQSTGPLSRGLRNLPPGVPSASPNVASISTTADGPPGSVAKPKAQFGPSYQESDSVIISKNGKSATFDFELGTHDGRMPTMADVDERVNIIRSRVSKSGNAVDVYSLARALCEYYGVRNVRELKCTDRRQGFFKETDINAVREFSMLQRKVLCVIQGYCIAATIATLYDLEKFICQLEGKETFAELKLGPLQKFPLIYHYFKFPHDREIKKFSLSDVLKHLWQYCGKEGKGKKVELDKFLEYLTTKGGFNEPYEMGVQINSIPLAISVVKKTRFGNMDKMKEAEKELIRNMEEDVDDYLRKIRRGLTGRNQRAIPGQPENVMQKIAGMQLEDAIMEIFKFAHDSKRKFQKNFSAGGFLLGADRIMDCMTFFRSKPILAKFFHIIVATCVFRRLEMEDYELLNALGFKEALKKMTDERMIEIFGETFEMAGDKKGKSAARKKALVNQGHLLQELRQWLEKSSKPMNLSLLSRVEQKVAQHFKATCFDDLGHGPFLRCLQDHSDLQNVIGDLIIVDESKAEDDSNTRLLQKEVRDFQVQCGSGKSMREIELGIRRQFPMTKNWTSKQIASLLAKNADDDGAGLEKRNATYLYSLAIGTDKSDSQRTEEVPKLEEGTGSLGHFRKEDVISCLDAAPLLENLALWSNWDQVFEPQFGDMKSFLSKQDKIQVLDISRNEFLKISLDSTAEDLKFALNTDSAQNIAGHLLSIINANGGVSETPLIHLANIIKSSLAEKIDSTDEAETTEGGCSISRIVLECMLKIPAEFCYTFANKLFLTPFHELLGDDYGRDPISMKILRVCKTNSERSYLHRLGVLLSIKEWKEDFKETRFSKKKEERIVANENINKSRKLVKAATGEKVDKVGKDKEERKVDDGQNSNKIQDEEKIPMKEDKDLIVFPGELPEASATLKPPEMAGSSSLNETDNVDEDSSTGSATVDDAADFIEFEDDEEEQDEASLALREMDERRQHCKDLIDHIRREEFGIGEELGEKEAVLLQRNNERLCRSLDRLSKELYAKDTHFVLELIQNADDNTYSEDMMHDGSEEKPSVAFIVDKDSVVILNNECGFEDVNIKAICDVGKSTKGAHRKGYIGQKGIGFKSVFRVTDCPEIHSNGFHICFDASKNRMGYILPNWQEEGFIDFSDYSPENFDIVLDWRTQITLPLKEDIMSSKKASSRFQNIHPSLLLFLNRLQTIIIENKIDEKCLVMKKRVKGNHIVELTQNGIPSTWFVVTKEIEMQARGEDEKTDVSLAFPLEDASSSSFKVQALPSQSVFAFLPLRSYGFKFLIQADFEVPSSREDIDRDSLWNQAVLQEIPRLVVEAFFMFRNAKEEVLPDAILCATKFFQYLPLENEILGVFKPIARKILQLLQKEDCIPVIKKCFADSEAESSSVEWTTPSQVILGDSMLRKIISPIELNTYLNLNFMSDVMQKNVSPALLKALGVHSESLDHLLEICKSHLKVIAEQEGKARETVQWIGKWLYCVSQFLERAFDTSKESLQRIGSLAVFPLSNGELVNLEGDAVFFPFQRRKLNSKEDRLISKLEADLCTIDERLLSSLDQIERLKVERLLADLGVKTMSAKEVIQNHILPAFLSGKWKQDLLVSYVTYIRDQQIQDATIIDVEKLKQCVVILTNQGVVKPWEQQVYFTQAYGNEVSLKELFPCVKWILLDESYLQTKTKESVKSWQKFFRLLGVADFPKLRKKATKVDTSDLVHCPSNPRKWPSTKDGCYYIDDLVVPEFDQILDSNDPQQLLTLALQLDKRWKSNFTNLSKVAVRNVNGDEIASTSSSLLVKLANSAWLPGGSSKSQLKLHVPKDLYLPLQEITAVLSDYCSYFTGQLNEPVFVEAIGIQRFVQIETVFQKIGEWSRDETFRTSLDHMINIYHYIKDHIAKVDQAEFDNPIIFVPMHSVQDSREITKGKFCTKGEVCVYDFSRIFARYPDLLPNKRHLLFQFYPKDILEFFQKDMKIDETPTLRDYINMACAVADEIKLPDPEGIQNLLALFAALGKKCIQGQMEDAVFDVVNSHGEVNEHEFEELRSLLDSTNSSFVVENIKDEKIFPTKSDRFVSLEETPFLPDDLKQMSIFESCENVHFLHLPDVQIVSKKRESGVEERKRKKQLKVGIHAFLALCNIKSISKVICSPEVIPENSVDGCYKWHKELSRLLPYVQRYLLWNHSAVYHSLVNEEGLPEKLREAKFITANIITAVHRLRGRDDVHVKTNKKCAIEVVEQRVYFYVGREYLKERDDVFIEFSGLFARGDKKIEDSLSEILSNISLRLKDKDSASHFDDWLERKKIRGLPNGEPLWVLPDAVEKVAPPTPKPVLVPEPAADSGGGMTCWPPRAPENYNDETREQKKFDQPPPPDNQSQWPMPAPPENVKWEAQANDIVSSNVVKEPPEPRMKRKDQVAVAVLKTEDHAAWPKPEQTAEIAQGRQQPSKASAGTMQRDTVQGQPLVAGVQKKQKTNEIHGSTNKVEVSAKGEDVRPSQEQSIADVIPTTEVIVTSVKESEETTEQENPSPLKDLQTVPRKAGVFQGEPVQKLELVYENVPVRGFDKKVQDLVVNLNDADTSAVGYLGEMIVYKGLQVMFDELINAGIVEVQWLNETEATLEPYDIRILIKENNVITDVRFIEVKTTTSVEDKAFEISSQQLKFALDNREKFDVYRVCGVNHLETIVIKRLPSLARYLDQKVVKLFVVL